MASVVIGWRPLFGTFRLASQNDEYTHILLILPISIAFIVIEWTAVASFTRKAAGAGSAMLCAATAVALLAYIEPMRMTPDLRLSLGMLAMVTWWIGSFLFCFGAQISRALFFPLGFLFLMVPLPEAALNELIRYLQQGTAFAAWLLFNSAGVPVTQDGLMLSIPGLTIEVAKECSSIRSSSMLLVTTLVLAQLFLRSPIRKALVIAIALPLSIAKNGLRIFAIAMLGTRVDARFITGRFHHQGGIIFFAISLLAILLVILLLERGERNAPTRQSLKALASC